MPDVLTVSHQVCAGAASEPRSVEPIMPLRHLICLMHGPFLLTFTSDPHPVRQTWLTCDEDAWRPNLLLRQGPHLAFFSNLRLLRHSQQKLICQLRLHRQDPAIPVKAKPTLLLPSSAMRNPLVRPAPTRPLASTAPRAATAGPATAAHLRPHRRRRRPLP